MSRIAKVPLKVPEGVTVSLDKGNVLVKGPKGTLEIRQNERIAVKAEGDSILLSPTVDDRKSKAFWGLYHRLIRNMLIGVSKGFKKELEIVGVGFRAQVDKDALRLQVGYSNPVLFAIPKDIKITTPKPTSIVIEGADKQAVGEVAAKIRRIRPPEPYKGKGIRYAGEQIKHKVGKAGAK